MAPSGIPRTARGATSAAGSLSPRNRPDHAGGDATQGPGVPRALLSCLPSTFGHVPAGAVPPPGRRPKGQMAPGRHGVPTAGSSHRSRPM